MSVSAKNKIALALVELRQQHPFYGVIANHLSFTPYNESMGFECETACVTRRGSCVYNGSFINELSLAETMGVICHEALHPALGYFDRIVNGCPERKNKAHDYVINDMIVLEELELPTFALHSVDYRNMSFEAVYDAMEDDQTPFNKKHKDTAQGEIEMFIDTLCNNDKTLTLGAGTTEDHWEKILYQAYHADKVENNGRTIGNLPDFVRLKIEALVAPPIPYKKLIKMAFNACGKKHQYSRKSRNKMNSFRQNTAILPGRKSISAKCVVIMDTSGSLFSNTSIHLQSAYSMIKDMARNYGIDLSIIQCDSEVKWTGSPKELEKEMKSKGGIIGCGGSDFNPAFEYLSTMKGYEQAVVFAFTDGMIAVPEIKPRNPTYWITAEHESAPTNDWGKHLRIQA